MIFHFTQKQAGNQRCKRDFFVFFFCFFFTTEKKNKSGSRHRRLYTLRKKEQVAGVLQRYIKTKRSVAEQVDESKINSMLKYELGAFGE